MSDRPETQARDPGRERQAGIFVAGVGGRRPAVPVDPAQGMDGVIVSNHGGRQVDGAVGALDALPGVVAAVGGPVPVLFDSGVRSGADVFRALALGAAAVCLGRPYAYGLALAGEAGAREVVRNLAADFDLTMGLAGCTSVAAIGRECLAREGELP